MTYQQVFDEAIGDVPVSTVDVERVIRRQRRARRVRLGAGGTAVVAAVLAVVLGTTSLVGVRHAAPPAEPSPAPTTVPGTPEDLDRIDRAVVAALVRAEPNLVWSGNGVDSGTTPNWQSQAGGAAVDASPTSGYRGHGSIRVGAGELTVSVWIERDGAVLWERLEGTCSGQPDRKCSDRVGPRGEQISIWQKAYEDREVPEQLKGEAHSRGEDMSVRALRPDGSLIEVRVSTADGEPRLPLTVDQVTAVALDGAIALAPLPPASPAPSSTVTTVAGTDQDGRRLADALTAGLKRQVDGFTWVTKWGGPVSDGPVWMSDKGHRSVDAPYLGYGNFRIGNRSGQISLGLLREGRLVWAYASPCPTAGLAARNCSVQEEPDGTKIRSRHLVADFGKPDAPHKPALSGLRRVEVLRPDGTLVILMVSGAETELSMTQLIAVARDPALALAPPPPAGTVRRGGGPPMDWDLGVGETAAGAALSAVSPDAVISVRPRSGGWSGNAGTQVWSLEFFVEDGGSAGDGEILVQRRAGSAISCATVGALRRDLHSRHRHSGECAESTRPDGKRVLTIVSRSSGMVTYTALLQRPDGGLVEVLIDNRPDTAYKGATGGAAPPLTLEQLVGLAAHPDLVNLLP